MSDENKEDGKIVSLVPPSKESDTARTIATLNKMLQEAELYETLAKLHKMRYDSYIKAGFKPEEALKLCATL